MAIESISSFFNKYRKMVPPDDAVRRAVVRVVESEADVLLFKKHIRVVRGTVFIKAASAAKHEIFLHKPGILGRLNRELGGKKVKDIC